MLVECRCLKKHYALKCLNTQTFDEPQRNSFKWQPLTQLVNFETKKQHAQWKDLIKGDDS